MSIPTPVILMSKPLQDALPQPRWPDGIRLAPLQLSDVRPIHALMQRAYAAGGGSVPDDWLDWWETVRADSEFDAGLCFVPRAGNSIVGFCLCWSSGFIKDLVVEPAWQRHGLGEALLSAVFAALAAHGFAAVQLKVVAGNAPAERLYRRMGFVPAIGQA